MAEQARGRALSDGHGLSSTGLEDVAGQQCVHPQQDHTPELQGAECEDPKAGE